MRRPALMFVLSGLVGALVAVPIAVYASHSFTDVPDTNTFHEDIAWLAEAGVTKGCNPPANTEFCPKDVVTRETMAAFLHRLAVNQVVNAATSIESENSSHMDGHTIDELAAFWNAQPGITGGMHNVTINPGERVQVAGGCDKASQGPIISGGFGISQTASLLLLASYPDPNILDPMPDNTDPGGNTPDQFLETVRQEGWTTVWEHIGPSPIVADISIHTLCSGRP